MKIKRKGKVFPSPSASSPPPPPPPSSGDVLSLLLPATILALTTALSLEDHRILAYMITRSIKTPTTTDLTPSPKRGSKKQGNSVAAATATHKPPRFDCDCFDCYTSYWCRWDSSPNRDLIHQAIEAFEEHLINEELSKKAGGGKRREKLRRQNPKGSLPECVPHSGGEGRLFPCVFAAEEEVVVMMISSTQERREPEISTAAECHHKGLTRKMLPDVLGLLNSRLWNLWNPTV